MINFRICSFDDEGQISLVILKIIWRSKVAFKGRGLWYILNLSSYLLTFKIPRQHILIGAWLRKYEVTFRTRQFIYCSTFFCDMMVNEYHMEEKYCVFSCVQICFIRKWKRWQIRECYWRPDLYVFYNRSHSRIFLFIQVETCDGIWGQLARMPGSGPCIHMIAPITTFISTE